jgi:diguanylate cyclase (GGDEF)-like protein
VADTSQPVAVGTMRIRLVASIFLAALVPFAAAYWIAGNYVRDQEQKSVETRLAFALRAAGAQYADVLAATRTRAHELAGRPDVAAAMGGREVAKLERILGPREAIVLASGTRIGWKHESVPVARVDVRSGPTALGTILVAAPPANRLLSLIRSRPAAAQEALLAVTQGGRTVSGPAAIDPLARNFAHVRMRGHPYLQASVALPGYSPSVRAVGLADEQGAKESLNQLQRRLGLAGLAALVCIVLYSIALSRPLGRWFTEVAEVARQADVDPLTGLANRRGFELALAAELRRSVRYERPCSLVMTDLDDFKHVNDEHGHDMGDAVLIAFSQHLRETVRANDVVARLGGEEFALLLPELDLDGALVVAERVRRTLAADTMRTRRGREVRITASFGVAEASGSSNPVELTRIADEALYEAKRNGKNRVVAAAGPHELAQASPSGTNSG